MRSAHDTQACIRSALRRRRRALGLTQQQAAQLLGMSRLTYHRIETGARHIHFAELAAICEIVQLPSGRTAAGQPARRRLCPRRNDAPRRDAGVLTA